jgi:ABC-type nitrate/sulfonate/bicarbonate transport system substrate-binding protein
MLPIRILQVAAMAAIAIAAASRTYAEDSLKVALGQRGNWESSIPELGQRAGIFKKHGLVLEILWTQGGGETQMAVISGSVDVGHGVGTGGAMAVFAKGAPIRAIANATTGASDLYWYVPSSSTIQSLKDANGKTIAYSTNGSSTNLTVLGFVKHFGLTAKPVATGNVAATFTQTMSGQVDIGWGSPPFAVDAMEQGRIRVVAHGSDLPSLREQTVRIQIANVSILEERKDAIRRYVRAYRETLEWMYSDPAALKAYAEWANVSEPMAQRVRDEFFPLQNLLPERLSGLDECTADAVALKVLSAPLTKAKLNELFQFMTSQ